MKQFLVFISLIVITQVAVAQEGSNDSIKLITDTSKIGNLKQLLKIFKGKPVFVDLWAPWCEPCKEEFKYSDTLYKALEKRGIQLLFVSLHERVSEVNWRSDINKFGLKGYHVLATKQLQDDLTTLIWGGIDAYSIPYHLLFDSQGNELLKNPSKPSDLDNLLKEIDAARPMRMQR